MGAGSRVESSCDKRFSPNSDPDGEEGEGGWGSATLAGEEVPSRERMLMRTAGLWAGEMAMGACTWGFFNCAGDLGAGSRGDVWRLRGPRCWTAGGIAGC